MKETGPLPIWRRWLDERYQVTPLIEFLRHKEVPMGHHSMVWYYLGGATMFFFVVQIVTGVLLLMYYQPGQSTAYESIRYLTTKVPFGWLMRSVHCWSAHLMIISLVVHMFSTMMLKAYRPPRELTWVTGYVLFALTLGFGFSGYLLPWNELAFFATAVGTDLVKSVPLVGNWLLQVLRGGPDVTIHTLYRFFALHVVVLPLAFVGLIGLHLLFIQRQGMAPPLGAKTAPRGMKFFPSFALRDVLLWMACFTLLLTLAVFVPYGPGIPGMEWELGKKADPLAPAYPGIKPEWYFLWTYQLLKEFPPHLFGLEGPQICLLVVSLLLGIWAIVPWLDRQAQRDRPSPAFSDFGWAAILFLTFLTLKAWDIGAVGSLSADDPASLRAIARVCALWTLGLGVVVVGARAWFDRDRWFFCSGAALLHVILHGLVGLSYLLAGVIALALGAVALAVHLVRNSRLPANTGRALGKAPLVLLGIWLLCGEAAAAEAQRAVVPQKLAALLAAQGENGQPVMGAAERAYWDGLDDHIKALVAGVVEKDIVTSPEHLRRLLALGLRPQKMEVLLHDNCVLCHTDPESHTETTLFTLGPQAAPSSAHLGLRDFVEEVHFRRGLSCAGCHGGDPASQEVEHTFVKEWPKTGRKQERGWILQFCARCHSDATLMNQFNPALPTDQLTKFRESFHGKRLLEGKDARAPSCVSCHGVHGIRGAKDPLSKVFPKRVPETCGACHASPETMAGFKKPDGSPLPTDQLANYRKSVHGQALLERGDLGAPACNSCHGNHAALPVGVTHVSQSCSLCHAGNAGLFEGSKHMQAFQKNHWSECAQCHGNHAILKTHDDMLGPGPDSLCVHCHDQYARENPECKATAEYFHRTITGLDHALRDYTEEAEVLAVKGLDTDLIHDQLNELADNVKKARSYIHSFTRNTFQQAAAPGQQAVARIDDLVRQAREEYRYRQVGLIASIGLMGLAMVLLYVKLRRMERSGSGPHTSHPPGGH